MIETVPSKLYWLLGFFLCYGLSWFFYRKEFFLKEGKETLKTALILLRTLSLFIVLFLCLDPFISYQQKHTLKPEIVVLVDDSKSINLAGVNKDSLIDVISNLKIALTNDVDVSVHPFGSYISELDSLSLGQNKTDFQQSFIDLGDLYEGRNVEGAVLLSDGIVNSGSKSKHAVEVTYPIFAIGVGDTSIKRDLVLKQFYHNDRAILGNEMPVRVEGVCSGYRGQKLRLEFYLGKKKVDSETLNISRDEFFFSVNKKILSDSIGIRKLTVRAVDKGSEFTLSNNHISGFIRVSKKKKKIQILYADPHPDIAAFKSSIAENDSYEVSTSSFSDYNWSNSPNLIVLFGMPQSKQGCDSLRVKLDTSSANRLYFLNSKVNYKFLNSLNFVIEDAQHDNEVQCSLNESFSLFDLSKESTEVINMYPPVVTPYGEYVFSRNFKILAFQKVGKVKTAFPLICFNESNKSRSGVFVGEGLWRWRLSEVMKDEASMTPAFDELFGKTLKYLTVDFNDDNIQLLSKNIFELGEKVRLKARVWNSIKEPVNNIEVHAMIKGKDKKLDLLMYAQGDQYVLDIGYLPAGEYELTLRTNLDGKQMSMDNKIIVKSFYLEQMVLQANHQLLREIANKTGGAFYTIDKLDSLINELNKKEYKVVSYFEFFTTNLMKFKWLLYCLITLLGAEWFFRKWYGTI